jgi:hypothetical protein
MAAYSIPKQDVIGSNQFVYEAHFALIPNLIKPALGKNLDIHGKT